MRATRTSIPRSFVSPGGHEGEEGPWGREDAWIISYRGKPAGKLFRNQMYTGKPWHATTRQLFWSHAPDAPTGIGFDVSAFGTVTEVFRAWGRSADEILDWSEGKSVRSLYSKTGTYRRGSASSRDPRRRRRRRL